jgi:hypothetical protein
MISLGKFFFLMVCALALMISSGCGIGVGPEDPASSGSPSIIVNSFVDLMASMIHRDKTADQMLLSEEIAGDLISGNRKVPDITKDDDALTGTAVTYASRPTQVCGTTQTTIEARVAHCAAQNTSLASWDGSAKGNAGQGLWKLVTYNGTHEVWRDERTTLLWTDHLGQTNWCIASGNSGGGPYAQVDPNSICDDSGNQNQTTPESWCTEDASFNSPTAYDSMKGGMRLSATATTPSITWRLPTLWDYNLAEIDGIRYVLPNLGNGAGWAWSASIFSVNRSRAWVFQVTNTHIFDFANRISALGSVRCVGH